VFEKLPTKGVSIGLGDRIGLATPGHMAVASEYDFFPVFAQQSLREMNFTGRTYEDIKNDVLAAARETGYVGSSCLDGDHLKTKEEISAAMDSGITMLTLDCSEHINEKCESTEEMVDQYAGKSFNVNGFSVSYSEEETSAIAALYGGVAAHTVDVWNTFPSLCDSVAFELSVDETSVPTDPKAHFLLAHYLYQHGVRLVTLAPRFPGEFQKGIDYIGDISVFARDLALHGKIADYFGYRLSVHSGSDKFAVFPSVGRILKGDFHLKTAGTSYLEAVRLIARVDPSFLMDIWDHALTIRKEMDKYYHISADASSIPGGMTPEEYLDNPDSRQILHVTYMFVLDPNQGYKPRFMDLLRSHKQDYTDMVAGHIARHVEALGISRR
jgi:hypothetical protein